ncbi:hypothetical protein HAV21_03525 [Paenarthrobacter sp. MSM-2-10-13]|uniref:hypothetical protein n=1 Tax=Paenarthrobacter sp. MSM-2-10-13 TaxID=2717318 RepID=UPI00141F8A47|nr:hypothetical protein [Paenarthrobacter sp. MSM-2-10-13]NHW45968.1 hypothetical protein [Paenarthrobacter sp. MSM-2-10-13]
MSTINVRIEGDKELVQKLRDFAGGQLDLTRSMGATGLYLTRFFAGEVFASRGGVIGKRWPRLNENYAEWKARRWPGRPPLIRTGLMNRSFKHKSTQLTTSLWNEAQYFDYHNDGRGVPQRVMMRIDQTREARIVKYIASDLTTQMDQQGLI